MPGTFIAPKVEKIQKMKFPRSLSRVNDHGSVALDLVIAADGSAIDVTLPEATDPEIARAALESMSRSHFKPASLNGIPVAFRVQIVYQFKRQS